MLLSSEGEHGLHSCPVLYKVLQAAQRQQVFKFQLETVWWTHSETIDKAFQKLVIVG